MSDKPVESRPEPTRHPAEIGEEISRAEIALIFVPAVLMMIIAVLILVVGH